MNYARHYEMIFAMLWGYALAEKNIASNVDADIMRMASLDELIPLWAEDFCCQNKLDSEEFFDEKLREFLASERPKVKNDEHYAGWICTDPDCCQYIKVIENGYELYMIQCVHPFDELYGVAHGIISRDEIDENGFDNDFVLSCYGYDSIQDLKERTGDEWERLLAEMLFESEVSCWPIDNFVAVGDYGYCEEYIGNLVRGV